MTGSWSFWVFITILVVLHLLLHLGTGTGGAAPDLLTVAALLGARRVNRAGATVLGAALGLLRDALSLASFGADTIALALVAYAGARTRELFVGDSRLFVLAYLIVGGWVHEVIYRVLAVARGGLGGAGFAVHLLLYAPLQALYAAVVGTAALALFRWTTGER